MSTETKPKIHLALIAIIQGVEAIKKDKKGEGDKYRFRGIDDVYNGLHDLFAKHGVICLPQVKEVRSENGLTKAGGSFYGSIVTIGYRLMADDGSFVECVAVGEGRDSGDKATQKALAYAHKYALIQMFLIPTFDAVDGDAFDPTVDAAEQLRKYNNQWEGKSLTQLTILRDETLAANQPLPDGLLGAISDLKALDQESDDALGKAKKTPAEKKEKAKPTESAPVAPKPTESVQPTQAPEKPASEAVNAPEPYAEACLNYVILKEQIQNQNLCGKRLGDLTDEQLTAFAKQWIVKYHQTIQQSPLKLTLREKLMEAFAIRNIVAGQPENIKKAMEEFRASQPPVTK